MQTTSLKTNRVRFDGAVEYEGEFKNELKHGYGVQTWENGNRYEG